MPADVGGVPTGRLGDAAAFSFYATKTMTTGGEGGMLVTNDASIAGRARRMRLHGISADSWNRYGAGGTWYYEVVEPGFKYNLTDLAAAIGLAQLERLDALAAQRAAIAAKYDAKFSGSDLLQVPPRRAGDKHAWHLMPSGSISNPCQSEGPKSSAAWPMRALGHPSTSFPCTFTPTTSARSDTSLGTSRRLSESTKGRSPCPSGLA